MKRQRCLSGKMHDSGLDNQLRGAKRLIALMFFHTTGNMESLGENAESVRRMTAGMDQMEMTFKTLDPVRDLYSDYPIIRRFLKFLKKSRSSTFHYLDGTTSPFDQSC